MSKLSSYSILILVGLVFTLCAVADEISRTSTNHYFSFAGQGLDIVVAREIEASNVLSNLRSKQSKTSSKKNTLLSEVGDVQTSKIWVGELEWIYLHNLGRSLKARVDSGATTSSITATNIQSFERDGMRWARFSVQQHNSEKPQLIEAPVLREVRIKQASANSYQLRLVVSLTINLGEHFTRKTEFTLADRTAMSYPVLLGREFLKGVALIDVDKRFLHTKIELNSEDVGAK